MSMRILDRMEGAWIGTSLGAESLSRITETTEQLAVKVAEAGGLAELELAMDDVGWREMASPYGRWNFSRQFLRKACATSRVMFLINPLIKRAVTVQELYVWGLGCTIKATHPEVNKVLQAFFTDPKNQSVIGESWPERERDQRIDGNTFFCFHRNKKNGTARVRLIPVDEVEDVYCNPEDAKEPWYYRRTPVLTDNQGELTPQLEKGGVYYPDIHYLPRTKPTTLNGVKIDWTACVLHVKTGGLSTMKMGVPELYSALNWATAYKRILENFATILQAYARIAMKMSGLPGKSGIAAAKSKLNTGLSSITAGRGDNNPPTNVASWMMQSGNVDVSPVKTANSTTGPDEARALRSMVAAGSDTPEHFFGDSDVGNFATSETLDRPTELKMISRQQMWRGIILEMCRNLVVWSAQAPSGTLREAGFGFKLDKDAFDGTQIATVAPPADADLHMDVTFPNILQREVTDRVRALVMAATLNGRPAEGIIPDRGFLFKLLMEALGEKDADYLMKTYYPDTVLQGFVDPERKLELDEKVAAAKVTAANKPAPKPAAGA